jgi:hypothetical protein
VTLGASVETMPVLLEIDEIITWLLDNDVWLTRDDWQTLAVRVGRNSAPALLANLDAEGLIDPDLLPCAVCDAWEMAEWPLRCLPTGEWIALWEAVGYLDNGAMADRPSSALTLFRGGHPSGWSWTDDQEIAQWFARRQAPLQQHPAVYRAIVEPGKLYARIHDSERGRAEHEYVVRGELLSVERVEGHTP